MKLQNKHFEDFKKHCLYYLDKFQLNDYDVSFEFKKINDDAVNHIGSDGNITIALDIEIDPFDRDINEYIKYLAKHEIIHCLIGEFALLANFRYVSEKEIYNAEEHLVRKLCKII